MNEEEKEIIERIQQDSTFRERKLLRIINKQKEEIEYYKSQKRYDDQFKHELLEEIRCKSLTIDSLNKILDDRLICIQGGRGLYSKLKGLDKEYLIREYLSMYKMCKQEIEKKEKIIDLMAEQLANYKHEEIICMEVDCKHIELQNEGKCIGDKECIKQYFEKKAEEDK